MCNHVAFVVVVGIGVRITIMRVAVCGGLHSLFPRHARHARNEQ